MLANQGSRSAARASANATTAAANAQLQATQETIARQEQAAAEGRAYVEPYRAPGLAAYDLMQGAAGMTGAAGAAAAQNAYGNSWESQVAADQQARTQAAMQSTNAAAGRGSSFNSGKALRALYEQRNQIDLANRNALYGKWGAMADTGYNAAISAGNYGVGAAGVAANALSNQANNLSQLYMQNGQTQANLALNNANNMGGALGGLSTIASNFNWGNALKPKTGFSSGYSGYSPSLGFKGGKT